MEDVRRWLGNVNKLFLCYGVSQVIGLLVLVMMLVWCVHYEGGMAWRWHPNEKNVHPFMMTLGFIYILANSLMVFRGFKQLSKYKLKCLHACLHLTSLVSIIIGLTAIWDYHNLLNFPNLKSLHTWIGLTTVILFVLQWCYSFAVFLYPGAAINIRTKCMNPHIFMGLSIFILAGVAAITGLASQSSYAKDSNRVYANILGLFLILFVAMVTFIVTKSGFKRLDYHT